MALLAALAEILPRERLVVAHFHHGTRGEEADRDRDLVRAEAARLGVAFVEGNREPGGRDSENELRQARLAFLESAAAERGCGAILTAHHADDRLETLFMRLLRGTGFDGLKAIPRRRGPFARPLLDFSREEILAYARRRDLAWREDATNADQRYLRNEVRARLMPVFRELGARHGGEEETSRRLGALFDEVDGLSREVNRLARRFVARHAVPTPRWMRLPVQALATLPAWLAGPVWRLVVRRAGGPAPDRQALERLVFSLASGARRSQLHGGIDVTRSCEQIFVRGPVHRSESPSWRKGKETRLCPTLGLELEVRHEAASNFELRFARAGDRLAGRKLKRVFLERRVPEPERPLVPVLARAGSRDLVWCFPDAHEAIKIRRASFPYSFPVATPGAGRNGGLDA